MRPPKKDIDLEATENTFLVVDSDSEASLDGKKQPVGASVPKAALMFTMSLAGAGVLGVSGAIAQTGGFLSIILLGFLAWLNKRSYDLLITLSLDTDGVNGSYENLGQIACGALGRVLVFVAKFTYTFFTLVVHVKVVKDNLPAAMRGIMGPGNFYLYLFESDDWVTFFMSLVVIFPMMTLRDMSVVAHTSTLKFCTVLGISFIILHLYFTQSRNNIPIRGTSWVADWVGVYPGVLASLGTFVFYFVGHHVVHLGYDSLRSDIKDITHWKRVSTYTVSLCIFLGVCMGFTVYITFWRETTSIMLQLYPSSIEVDFARILVCFFVIFTLPLPFYACREMMIMCIPREPKSLDERSSLEWWLQAERQLITPLHLAFTFLIWLIMTALAILAPSLNDVLNLGGCASGSLIAYILPGLFYVRLRGWCRDAVLMLLFGSFVGSVGTFFAAMTMIRHITEGRA